MRAAWHDIWGCAHGPVKGLEPHTRVLVGATVFAACMTSPPSTRHGSLVTIVATLAWLAACRPPIRVVRSTLALGLVLFLPYFLLLPLLPAASAADTGTWGQGVAVPWSVLLRGLSGTLVSVSTVTSLTASDLHEALVRLPVPSIVSAILVQIVHQTATLFYETKRVASAMAVRGASSGVTAAWRVLVSLPKVWLPRVLVRAERVAAAMELRGYCDEDMPSFRQGKSRLADGFVLVLGIGVLALAIMLRVWGAP
jgi:energy-coupling factor transporter transmembrane protein EcfT